MEQCLLLAGSLTVGGDEVVVTCANASLAERFSAVGADAHVVPFRNQADATAARRVWRLARGAEVLHAHDRRAGLWVRLGPRPRRGGLRVYTAHGVPFEYHPPPAGPARPGLKPTLLYRGLDSALCARCDAVIVPSHAVRDDLVDRLGYPAAKLHVIPNGIVLPEFSPGGGELIATFSVLERFKGIDVFLRAAAELAGAHPDWRFAAFGSGSDEERLRRLAGELGLDGRLEWPGFVPAPDALARLRVYVLSSYWENAPMALLEAMAAGVPVVATSVCGVPEVADESVAELVPPGDHAALASAVERVIADPERTAATVRAARQRVEERFTAERNAGEIRQLYERLLAR